MRAENCREWRESLGAYALGQLPEEERPALEAHLEGCAECRAELDSLSAVARLMEKADPERLGDAPTPPPALADRVFTAISAERQSGRRRRRRFRLSLAGATAAVVATVVAILVLGGGDAVDNSRHATFASLPPGLKIGAKLEPSPFGTEVHMYVKGAPRGVLCRVFVRGRDGERLSAGSFRYRSADSYPILSAGIDLPEAEALGIRVGGRTFLAPVEPA